MKKSVVFLVLALLMTLGVTAGPIDNQQAQRLAQEFWAQRLGAKGSSEFTEAASYYPFIHLLNRQGGGFVIVSADDRALPILAYSTTGRLDVDNMPKAMRKWLACYDRQVALACQQETPAMQLPPASKDGDSVPALMTTRWNQNKFYNEACPYDNSIHDWDLNHRPYAGCTATAMAQVMRYWQWPPHGIGSYSYSYAGVQGVHWNYGTLSADFEHTTYDWEHMPDELRSSSSPEEIEAVSTLIYHCGVSAQMDYNCDGSGESGAYVSLVDMQEWDGGEYCAENALYTFFGYKDSVRGLCKEDYADSTWKRMLKEELRAGRPVIYQGYTGTGWNAYGHCFVIDGFDASGMFHVNWGWSGECDGFFSLSALNPDGYYNYAYYQEGLFYVEPNYHCFDNDTTGGDTTHVSLPMVKSSHPVVWSEGGRLHIRGAEGLPLLISDPMGRIICRQRSLSEHQTIDLTPSGVYLLRIGSECRKVVVR